MYYDKDGNYVGDQPSDIPDTSEEEKKKKLVNRQLINVCTRNISFLPRQFSLPC